MKNRKSELSVEEWLGNLSAVRDAFVGFQPRLYERS